MVAEVEIKKPTFNSAMLCCMSKSIKCDVCYGTSFLLAFLFFSPFKVVMGIARRDGVEIMLTQTITPTNIVEGREQVSK